MYNCIACGRSLRNKKQKGKMLHKACFEIWGDVRTRQVWHCTYCQQDIHPNDKQPGEYYHTDCWQHIKYLMAARKRNVRRPLQGGRADST